MQEINDRLALLVEKLEKGSQANFARRIGVRSGVVGDMFGKRKNKPSFELLSKIAGAYPQLRLDWLVLGEGPMLHEAAGEPHLIRTVKLTGAEQPTNTLLSVYLICEDEAYDRIELKLEKLVSLPFLLGVGQQLEEGSYAEETGIPTLIVQRAYFSLGRNHFVLELEVVIKDQMGYFIGVKECFLDEGWQIVNPVTESR